MEQLRAALDSEAGRGESEHLHMQRDLHALERQLSASQVPPSQPIPPSTHAWDNAF